MTNINTNSIDQSSSNSVATVEGEPPINGGPESSLNNGEALKEKLGEDTLGLGSQGEAVKVMQQILNQGREERLEEDGRLGPLTQNRLKEFQSESGLKTDGLLGKNSRAKLLESLQSDS